MRLQPLHPFRSRERPNEAGSAQSSCPFCGSASFAEGQEPFLCPDGSAGLPMRALPSRASSGTGYDRRGSRADLASLDDAIGSQCAGAYAAHKRLARDGALHRAANAFAVIREYGPDRALEGDLYFEKRSAEAEARLGTASRRMSSLRQLKRRRSPEFTVDSRSATCVRPRRVGRVSLSTARIFIRSRSPIAVAASDA